MKKVVFSLDVEDWYHLDYFDRAECDESFSMLDGVDVYVDLMRELSLPSSFFVLGEIAEIKIDYFKHLVELGHDIGCHGWDHQRPLTMSLEMFREDLHRCTVAMEKINGSRGYGYRAPCFSLDRDRLDIIKDSGFTYDSSRIDFGNHSLYGSIEMFDYKKNTASIYQRDDFCEFEVSTYPVLSKKMPISCGGYLRIFPWTLTRELVRQYIKKNDLYVLYIHPFELSQLSLRNFPKSTSALTKFRFQYGRKKVVRRLKKLVHLLHSYGYEFTTFRAIQEELAAKELIKSREDVA